MDQKKIGGFLKELRNEKGITQEQLAEELGVSNRTVSRWETGFNMPDISVLIEIADYFDVSIPEIINGERKSEMNEEVKEMATSIATYAEEERNVLLKRLRYISLAGLIGLFIWVYMPVTDVPILEALRGAGLGTSAGALIASILFTTGNLEKMHKSKKPYRKVLKTAAILFVIGLFAAALIATFKK
ncbi:MAG: helix-turn-helix transcriptional regulator [Erysipelotrichaceae bacterium]|nr:helix-turn-helix transcriptional regulator [Erysipelotrichaceae bacterium]